MTKSSKPSLKSFLTEQGYIKVNLKLTKTHHFEMKATLNGVKGRFILDTGASISCVGFEAAEKFKLKAKDSPMKAAGAGATDMMTQLAKKNTVKIGKWKQTKVPLVLFDITHVNTALTSHDAKPVDGIIGADILNQAKGIIDYNKKCLFLKLAVKKPKAKLDSN
ncbi:retropepsin-like aspartic protease [Bizionia sediminis]|uniref:Retropepsin-like aspartic protease n=1 Tax=Bizionia sediminis TaxID=1737064 RepID=A0ABW5KTZ7_9FLAO